MSSNFGSFGEKDGNRLISVIVATKNTEIENMRCFASSSITVISH